MNLTEIRVLKDATNVLMSVVQIRQLRVVENACLIPKPLNMYRMTCVPEYEEKYSGSFPDMDYAGRLQYIWKKQNDSEIGSIWYTLGINCFYLLLKLGLHQ